MITTLTSGMIFGWEIHLNKLNVDEEVYVNPNAKVSEFIDCNMRWQY